MKLLGGIVESGITVVTLNNGEVFADMKDARKLIMAVLDSSRANSESSHKSSRLRQAYQKKRDAASDGKAVFTKQVPMWLKLKADRSGYDLVPEFVETVRMIFDLTITHGKNKVAQLLNEAGRPTFKPSVNGWGTSAVSHVLNNRAVLGEFQPMSKLDDPKRRKRKPVGEPIKKYFPAIIDETTYYRAQDAVAGRRTAKATKQSVKFNVWQKVARCIHCGSPMHMVNKGRAPKGQTYIECSIGRKGLCESHKLIRLDHSEQVFRAILACLDSMSLVRDSGGKLAKDLAAINGRIAEQEAKLSKAVAAFDAEPSPDIAAAVRRMRETLTELTNQREHTQGELAAEDAIDYKEFMRRLDLESPEGRAAANALLQRLKVLVFADRGEDARNPSSSYVVTQDGEPRFAVAYADGKAGYRKLSPWKHARPWMIQRGNPHGPLLPLHMSAATALKHAGPVHFEPPKEAGSRAYEIEEDADARRQADADEDYWPIQE